MQEPKPHHFDDAFKAWDGAAHVPIIHLHGMANSPNRRIVFSRNEYVQQIATPNPWMSVLSDYLSSEPFIIAGTSLDEFDLDYYLSQRNPTSIRRDRGPSILVEPFPDAVTRGECVRRGLELFEGNFLDFISYLEEIAPHRPTPIELIPKREAALLPEKSAGKTTLLQFWSDFDLVPGSADPTTPQSRFKYGHIATWGDLQARADISRSPANIVLNQIEKLLHDQKSDVKTVIISDKTGAGKTTFLRRCAFELAQRGVTVLNCSPIGRIEPRTTSSLLDMIDGPVCVVVDNFGDQAYQVAEILQRIEKKDIVFLCAERDYRIRHVEQEIGNYRIMHYEKLSLNKTESIDLMRKYISAGLIGDESAVANQDKFAADISRDPIAVACCRILNDFKPLTSIIDSIFSSAPKTIDDCI